MKWRATCLGLLSCLALYVSMPVYADEALPDNIRVVSDIWPGYMNADGTGLGWEIMRLLFEPVGVRLEHRSEVYTRGVGLVQRGEADAWLGSYGSSEGYKGVFYPRRSYAIDPVSGLSLRSKPAPTLATLGNYRAAWMRGYGYERFLPGINGFREIERRSGVLSMLERRRVDLYIDALPEIADLLASTPEPDRYRITELTGLPMYPGFADTPQGRAFAALYDRRLEQVSKDGSLRRLYKRWEQPYLFDTYPESLDASH